MKKRLFYFLFGALSVSVMAQNPSITNLRCNAWASPQWTPYATLNADKLSKTSEEDYLHYDDRQKVSIITPKSVQYATSPVAIRWTINESKIPCKVIVRNLFDDVLYETKTESCGFLIDAEVLAKADKGYFYVVIVPANPELDGIEEWALIDFRPMEQKNKESLLAKLKDCKDLACKVETLVEQKAYSDAMSLIEREKYNDPKNTSLDKLYWSVASKARLETAGKGVERQ